MAKRQLNRGRLQFTSVLEEDGTLTTDRERIVERSRITPNTFTIRQMLQGINITKETIFKTLIHVKSMHHKINTIFGPQDKKQCLSLLNNIYSN